MLTTQTSTDLYEAPSAELPETMSLQQLAWIIYVVLIIAILALGGVAIYCIYKGKKLVWAQKGWTHWTIACG